MTFITKKTHCLKPRTATINVGLMIMFILFLIPFSSALDLNPFATKISYDTEIKEDTSDYLKEEFNTNYGVIKLSKTFFWFESDRIAEYSLIENTQQCLINCEAKGKAILYQRGSLFNDLKFKDALGNFKELAYYKYYILITEEYEIPIYFQECGYKRESLIKKGEIEEYCVDVQNGTEKRERKVWKEYKFEELDIGNYEWKIEAKKELNQNIDFLPYSNGIELSDWAWWNSSWVYTKNLTITENNIANRKMEPIEVNITGLKLSTSNCSKEIRVIDNNGNEINSQITNGNGQALANGNQWCVILFLANVTKNTPINYTIYYGNSLATEPTYTKTTFNQTTCPLNFNSGYFSGTMATQLGTINLLTTTGGMVSNFSSERFPTSTLGTWSGCSVIENGNVRSIINLTRANQWMLMNIYQNAEKINFTNQHGTGYYLSGNINSPSLTSQCSNESGIRCDTDSRRAVSERWFSGNNSNSVIYTGWSDLNWWYDISGRWVWFYDGGNKGTTSSSFYFGMSNQTTGYNYARAEYLASLNPLTTSLNSEKSTVTDNSPTITLNSPADTYNSNSQIILFNCTGSDDKKVQNITFYLNNSVNGTNTSVYNNTPTIFNRTLAEGVYSWNCGVCDNATTTQCVNGTARTFSIDTTPPQFTDTTLNVSTIYNVGDPIRLNTTITDTNLDTCWYNYNNANTTFICTSGVLNEEDITTIASQTDIRVWANDSFGNTNYSELLTFAYDTTPPTILVTSGNGTINYQEFSTNHTLNITFTDTNLDNCWINYNGTNQTFDCTSGVDSPVNFTLQYNLYNATIWANDTLGNENSSFVSWDYRVFENNRTFNNETLSGSIEDFSINVTLGNETEIVSAIFVYNGTNTSSVITSIENFRLITIDDFEIPIFSSAENISFYWEILLSDGTNFSTYTSTHLVSVLKLDNCSTYTFQLANISLFDEETLQLIRGDIEVYYSILNKPNYNSIKNLSGIFENISNTLICSDINLSNQNLAYSTEIRYSSEKGLFDDVGYAKEFYHIQRSDIGELITISLYDLHLNETTEFEIEYQNEDLVKVANAIVQLQRKYIAEDIYRVVEAPITSNEGTAVLHIDLNTNKYKITIIKDGVVLDIFDNIVFVCDNVLSGQCEQKLYGSIDPTNDIPLETIQDFSYTLSEVNNTITIDFSIPSGVPSNINFLMYQSDQFGTTTLCNRTIISSAGSTSCIYNNTITDSYLDLILTRDGNVISSRTYIVQEADGVDFLDNNFFIVFIFLISIVGMAFTSPEWIIMNSVIVFVISGALWLLNGMNFVMGLGGLAWLILGAGILIFKLTKQEDR